MADLTPFQILEVVAVRDKAEAERMLLLSYQTGIYSQADLRKVDINSQLERVRDPDKPRRIEAARQKAIKAARMRIARG